MVHKKRPLNILYQWKITLLEITPPVWRRIQVADCTLDQLHEHIQMVMGWSNSHLHRFEIDGRVYADPDLMEESFEESDCGNSVTTLLSDIVPVNSKQFSILYIYDFGDNWRHEVMFEGWPARKEDERYPLCLEGARACPPEDVGGVSGYADFVKIIRDRSHPEHAEMLEWAGGLFDPDEFDAKAATKSLRKGLPDWRLLE